MAAPKNRPLSPEEAPDTARVYERARPEAESGMGRLDSRKPLKRGRDRMMDASHNQHKSRQINADDSINAASKSPIKPQTRKPQTKSTAKKAVAGKTKR